MVDVAELRKLYAEKLLQTGSHDAAFTKAVWVAYKKGLNDGRSEEHVSTRLQESNSPGQS